MHFRRYRTGHGPGIPRLGPKPKSRVLLGQILRDREAIPDQEIAIPKHRHLARRGMLEYLIPAIRRAKIDSHFLEGNAEMGHDQPRPEAPARRILVADDQRYPAPAISNSPLLFDRLKIARTPGFSPSDDMATHITDL